MAQTKLLDVRATVNNLQIFDYRLNHFSDTYIKSAWGKRFVQFGSLATHTMDIMTQSIAYPFFRLSNPFVTVGVNIENRDFGKAVVNSALIPVKLLMAIPRTVLFEGKQLFRLGFSLTGINTIINVIRGKKQTDAFFEKRMAAKIKRDFQNETRKGFLLTKKQILNISSFKDYNPTNFITINENAEKRAKKSHFWSFTNLSLFTGSLLVEGVTKLFPSPSTSTPSQQGKPNIHPAHAGNANNQLYTDSIDITDYTAMEA